MNTFITLTAILYQLRYFRDRLWLMNKDGINWTVNQFTLETESCFYVMKL